MEEQIINQEVNKPKRRIWLWIVIPIVAIIIIITAGFVTYYFKLDNVADKGDIVTLKCTNFCPDYSYDFEYYNSTTKLIESNTMTTINSECLKKCLDENFIKKNINPNIGSMLKKRKINETEILRCYVSAVQNKGKDCINELLGKYSDIKVAFVNPQYQNTSIKILGLNCTNNQVTATLSQEEGYSDKIIFILYSAGDTITVKKQGMTEGETKQYEINVQDINSSQFYISHVDGISIDYLISNNTYSYNHYDFTYCDNYLSKQI
jgi:hypothetical protein